MKATICISALLVLYLAGCAKREPAEKSGTPIRLHGTVAGEAAWGTRAAVPVDTHGWPVSDLKIGMVLFYKDALLTEITPQDWTTSMSYPAVFHSETGGAHDGGIIIFRSNVNQNIETQVYYNPNAATFIRGYHPYDGTIDRLNAVRIPAFDGSQDIMLSDAVRTTVEDNANDTPVAIQFHHMVSRLRFFFRPDPDVVSTVVDGNNIGATVQDIIDQYGVIGSPQILGHETVADIMLYDASVAWSGPKTAITSLEAPQNASLTNDGGNFTKWGYILVKSGQTNYTMRVHSALLGDIDLDVTLPEAAVAGKTYDLEVTCRLSMPVNVAPMTYTVHTITNSFD